MYLAMNRFRILRGKEEEFEEVWRNRDRRLSEVPGFVDFHLLRGPESEGTTLYASHTIWESEADFANWTRSEHFRAAHKGAGARGKLYEGHPQFEGFTSVEGA
ncbi:MAG: antibiotic biosynthesis monooxygenase family protein [Pikeienuella sp.]